MKTAIVPAQITTVEDRIAGNLTLQQMILLIAPVFIDFAVYAVFPMPMRLLPYKVVIMVLLSSICLSLAIRIRGKLLIHWLVTLVRYNVRPRYFVYNKNDDYMRYVETPSQETASETVQSTAANVVIREELELAERVRLEELTLNPAANLSFKLRRKGGLNVSITEVE